MLVTAGTLCRCHIHCRCDRRRTLPWLPQCTGSLKGSYLTVVRRSRAPTVIPLTSTLSATVQSTRSGKFACPGGCLFTVYQDTWYTTPTQVCIRRCFVYTCCRLRVSVSSLDAVPAYLSRCYYFKVLLTFGLHLSFRFLPDQLQLHYKLSFD